MFGWLRKAKGAVPFLLAFVWAGCNLMNEGPGPWNPLYSVSGFTALDDSSIAVRLDLHDERWLPPDRRETRRERTVFVAINRYRNDVRLIAGDLPLSARPALPSYFVLCRDGTPASLSPGGPKTAREDCRKGNVAISSGGKLVLFSSDSGAFQILGADLKPLSRTPIPPPHLGWNSVLAADEDSGFVTLLLHLPDNRGYWRRYPVYDSAAADSAYLIWPTVVRIAGYGARILCSEIDEASALSACWHPRDELGFADAARRYCALDCEWNPATGSLLATMNYPGRFAYVQPRTGSVEVINANPMLDSLARVGFFP